jgi:hypothetical protein
VERLQKDQWFAGFNDERYAVNIEISGLLYNFVQFQNTYDCCHSQLISVLIVHSTVSRRNRVLLSPPFCADTCIVYSRQDRSALTLILSFVVISVASSPAQCLYAQNRSALTLTLTLSFVVITLFRPHPHIDFCGQNRSALTLTLSFVVITLFRPHPHIDFCSQNRSALTLTLSFVVIIVPPSPPHCLLWSLLFRPHPHIVFTLKTVPPSPSHCLVWSSLFHPHPHTVLCGHHCSALTLTLSFVVITVPRLLSHSTLCCKSFALRQSGLYI